MIYNQVKFSFESLSVKMQWEVILSLTVLVAIAGNHLLTPSSCGCSALVMSGLDVVHFHWIQCFYKSVITIVLPLSLCTLTGIGSSPMVPNNKEVPGHRSIFCSSFTYFLFNLLVACLFSLHRACDLKANLTMNHLK